MIKFGFQVILANFKLITMKILALEKPRPLYQNSALSIVRPKPGQYYISALHCSARQAADFFLECCYWGSTTIEAVDLTDSFLFFKEKSVHEQLHDTY